MRRQKRQTQKHTQHKPASVRLNCCNDKKKTHKHNVKLHNNFKGTNTRAGVDAPRRSTSNEFDLTHTHTNTHKVKQKKNKKKVFFIFLCTGLLVRQTRRTGIPRMLRRIATDKSFKSVTAIQKAHFGYFTQKHTNYKKKKTNRM